MAKVDRVAMVLSELAGYRREGKDAEKVARVKKLLGDKASLVVVKAVELLGQWGVREAERELAGVFARYFSVADLGCGVKTAVAKVLVEFEVGRESEAMPVMVRGLRHVQKEPAWGGSVDVAAVLRGWCAVGIAASGHRDQVRLILPLLADAETHARAMGIRALAQGGSDAAEAVIRFKLIVGDSEDEVVGECLSALAGGWSERSMELLKASLEDPRLRPLAAMALGECRHPEAWPVLKAAYEWAVSGDRQREILAGLALCRREEAVGFLIEQITTARPEMAGAIVEALGPRREYGAVWEKVRAAVARRGEREVKGVLERVERG